MSKRASPANIYDIAAHAGVSISTVSRYLNHPDSLSEKTLNKVAESAATLGYSPKFAARAMAEGRTKVIGAIIPTMENAIFAGGLQAFQEELERLGFTMVVATSNYSIAHEKKQIQTLIARGAEGLLLVGYDRDPSVYTLLENQEILAVVAWAFDHTKTLPAVGFDNFDASRAMAREMIKLGHREMGLISFDITENDRARARKNGIEQAIREIGLSPNTLKMEFAGVGIQEGGAAMERLIAANPELTVVFCGNDVLAVGALIRAKEMGFDIPKDISITGFDDIELSQVTSPKLTTVRLPHRRMGRSAAQKLIALLNNTDGGHPEELETEIKLRGSHGPPRGSSV